MAELDLASPYGQTLEPAQDLLSLSGHVTETGGKLCYVITAMVQGLCSEHPDELGVPVWGAAGSPGGREEVRYLGPSWENTKRKILGGPWLGGVFGEENVYWDLELAVVCELR